MLGNDLLSHRVTPAVPSALEGLTSVFGMGTGVSPPQWSPNNGNYTEPRDRTQLAWLVGPDRSAKGLGRCDRGPADIGDHRVPRDPGRCGRRARLNARDERA